MLFFTSMVNQLLSFILPLQFEKMDFRIAALGLQLSFFSIGALVSRILLLNLIREENMKRIAAAGLGLMTASCIGFLFLQEPVPAMICRILQGAAFGMASSAVPSVAMGMIKSAEKSIGIIGIASISASLAGPFLALEIVKWNQRWGFKLVCILAVFSAFAAFLLCVLIPVENVREKAAVKQRKKRSGGLVRYLFFTTAFLMLCNCYMALLTVFAESENKLEYVSAFLVTASLSSILVRAELKRIMKTDRRLYAFFFMGAMLYCITMFWLSGTLAGISFWAGGTAVGCFSGIMMSCAHLDILKLDESDSAHANTLFYFVQDIANILCGVLWSFAASHIGYDMCFRWSGVGIAVLCGGFIAYRVRIEALE